MRRRAFITLLRGAAAWPLAASAQQSLLKMPRIGIIDPAAQWDPFQQGLRELGYIESRNIAIEYRSAEAERLVAAATELAQLPLDVIVTVGSPDWPSVAWQRAHDGSARSAGGISPGIEGIRLGRRAEHHRRVPFCRG